MGEISRRGFIGAAVAGSAVPAFSAAAAQIPEPAQNKVIVEKDVTFGKGGGQDLWLHARGVPGAHVVVKFDGRSIPSNVVDYAASLAAYYSGRRNDGKVEVDVTRCLYVKKIKGAAQGMVNYKNEETLSVAPHDEKTDLI